MSDLGKFTTEQLQEEINLRKRDCLIDALAETFKKAYGMNASYLKAARAVAASMGEEQLANIVYNLRFARSKEYVDFGAPEFVSFDEYKIKVTLPPEE